MGLLGKIATCQGAGGTNQEIYISINYDEYKKKYQQTGDIFAFKWHKIHDDFEAPTVEASREADTSDVMNGKRKGEQATSFKETDTFTIDEEYLSSLNQELFAIGLESDDFILDAMNCGINVMRVLKLPSGAIVRKTYFGSSSSDLPRMFESIFDAEAQMTMTVVHKNSPVIENIGFEPKLPTSWTMPKIETSETAVGEQRTLSINGVTSGFRADGTTPFALLTETDVPVMITQVFDVMKNGNIVISQTIQSTSVEVAALGTTPVEVENLPTTNVDVVSQVVVVSLLYLIEDSNTYYYDSWVKEYAR